tara:strand:+ start:303 stop:614 length:312 start_codon:yes stop_codon:yes gene_type:complete
MLQNPQYIKRFFPNGLLKEEQYGYDPRIKKEGIIALNPAYECITIWHREDGPARLVYNKSGRVVQYNWWVHGNKLSQKIIDKYFLNPLKPTDEEVFIFKLAEL